MKLPASTGMAIACLLTVPMISVSRAQVPDAIAAPGQVQMVTIHAEGAQIYECKADNGGRLIWQFREPIATLIVDGKTVGRHYAGPNWELADGSAVTGRVAARAAGERHSVPQARGHVAAWEGPADRRHNDPEDQHEGRHGRRPM